MKIKYKKHFIVVEKDELVIFFGRRKVGSVPRTEDVNGSDVDAAKALIDALGDEKES